MELSAQHNGVPLSLKVSSRSSSGVQDKQENEIFALKAIYAHDFVDETAAVKAKRDANKAWKSLPPTRTSDFRIRLKWADLVFHIPFDYPNLPPSVRLDRFGFDGLTVEINAIIQAKIRECIGREMIWDIATAVTEFLEVVSLPSSTGTSPNGRHQEGESPKSTPPKGSAHDQMTMAERAKREEVRERRKKEYRLREEKRIQEYNELYRKVEAEIQRKQTTRRLSLLSPGIPKDLELSERNPSMGLDDTTSPPAPDLDVMDFSEPLHRDAGGNPSRYLNDFEEVEFIGKGGYGSVVKVRNKLDGRLYAVKKVVVDPVQKASVLREVRALSRLSNAQTVRYYQAWTEFAETSKEDGTNDDTTDFSNPQGSRGIDLGYRSDDSKGDSHVSESSASDNEFVRFGYESGNEEGPTGNQEDWLTAQARAGSFIRFRTKNQKHGKDFENDNSDYESFQGDPWHESQTNGFSSPSSAHRSVGKKPALCRILYIQMEYCGNRSFRDILDERALTEAESWQYFRQILEGLAHIHRQGLIHRDLKPQNIFVDDEGNLKIGDFGLATQNFQEKITQAPESAQEAPNFASVPTDPVAPQGMHSRAQTLKIGTTLYVAPEVMTRGPKYNNKVDLYSLGIVFYEMIHRFATGMERVMTLESLRRPQFGFSPEIDQAENMRRLEIVRSLLSHDPKQRPSARRLLRGNLLPPSLETSHLNEAIRVVTDTQSPHHTNLINKLFERKMDVYQDFAYDHESINPDEDLANSYLASNMRDSMTAIFKRHGAVEFDAPLFMLHTDGQPSGAVKMIDRRGEILQLPYDLTTAFGRYVARADVTQLKRYSFARVFRDNPNGGQPRAAREADFDIINTPSTPRSIVEGEVLGVADEVMAAFPPTRLRGYHIRFNDMRLVAMILDACGLKWDMRILVMLETAARSSGWSQIRHNLTHSLGVEKAKAELLCRFKLEGELDDVLESVEDILKQTPRRDAILDELRNAIKYTRYLGSNVKMVWYPLLVHKPNVYQRGLVFQVSMNAQSQQKEVLAAGGRYDGVLQRFYLPVIGRKRTGPNAERRVAVGLHIAMEKFLVLLNEDLNAAFKVTTPAGNHTGGQWVPRDPSEGAMWTRWEPRMVEVFISSFSRGLLQERMNMARDLWNANIRSDFLYDDSAASMDKMMDLCRYMGVMLLVIVKRDAFVKVKDLRTKKETEVHKSDLVQWLQHELAASYDSQVSTASTLENATDEFREERITVIDDPNRRSRSLQKDPKGRTRSLQKDDSNRKRRQIERDRVVDKASSAVDKALSEIPRSQTLAVPLSKELVTRLAKIDVLNDESFRKLVAKNPNDREALVTVRSRLKSIAKDYGRSILTAKDGKEMNRESDRPSRYCFLYSVKDDWLEIYQFLRP